MATESSGSQSRELDQTPTWAVAGVCALIILISIALEKVLHKVGTVCASFVLQCFLYSLFLSFVYVGFSFYLLLFAGTFLEGFFLFVCVCPTWVFLDACVSWSKISDFLGLERTQQKCQKKKKE